MHRALQSMQDALNDIQTDAASRNFCDLIGGTESGAEDEIQNVGLTEPAGFLALEEAAFDGAGLDLLRIDAATIVDDFYDNLISLMVGLEADGSMSRFAGASTFLRAFDAVSNRIANQMRHWLGDGIQKAFVQGSVLSIQNQVDLFVALLGNVPNHTGKSAEQLLDRDHADLHHRALQIVQYSGLKGHSIGEAAAHGFLGIARGEFVEHLLQHGFSNDQFAHEIEHSVDAFGIHAQDVL